jgi:hypothetical protein
MKVGDLVRERGYPEVGLIIKIGDRRRDMPYFILCPNGNTQWFNKKYVEEMCEVINESR